MLRPSLPSQVTVETHLDAQGTVDGDPGQLSQIVLNLCINAYEAMPDGGTLLVTTRDLPASAPSTGGEHAATGQVELVVRDTGTGIPDDIRARIFEPFFTTKRHGRVAGTGLGLSTVYGVVHLHQGTIDVTSAQGQGSAFTVRLPLGTLGMPAAAAQAVRETGGGLVLVVEDEPMLRQFSVAALTRLGYEALTAADGAEGVELFRARHAELRCVLLDLKMPRKSGREAFMVFREIDAAVPILICSGYGDNEEAQGLISLGARGLLAKPYRVAQLADILARLEPARRA
jgi:CheY-like chemotaxis protein